MTQDSAQLPRVVADGPLVKLRARRGADLRMPLDAVRLQACGGRCVVRLFAHGVPDRRPCRPSARDVR